MTTLKHSYLPENFQSEPFFIELGTRWAQIITILTSQDSIKKNLMAMMGQAPGLAFAHIDQQSGFDHIFISSELVLVLRGLYKLILSSPNVFEHVGDPQREIAKPPYSNSLPLYFDELPIPCNEPNDAYRSFYADFLTEISLDFILVHELTHLRNGHLEVPHCLALEMDADSIAASFLVNDLKVKSGSEEALRIFTKNPEKLEFLKQVYSDPEEVVFAICFSMNTLFHFLSNGDWTQDQGNTHPAPHRRNGYINFVLMDHLSKREISVPFDLLCSDAMLEFKKAYNVLTGESLDMTSFQDWFSDQTKGLLSELMTEWEAVKPALETKKRTSNRL